MKIGKSRLLIVTCALGVSLSLTACTATKPAPQQSPQPTTTAPSVPPSDESTQSPSPAAQIADWGSERSKKIVGDGIKSISERLNSELMVDTVNASGVKTDLVDDVSAMRTIFQGLKDKLPGDRVENFQTGLQTLGTGIDRIVGLEGEELAQGLNDSRQEAAKLAKRLVLLQEEAGVEDPSVAGQMFTIEPGHGFGLISKDSTQESIKAAYGEENFKMEERVLAPDFTAPVGVLFSGDPEKELWVIFEEGAIAQIRVPNTSESSVWKTLDGLGLGSTLEEVIQANGTAFQMTGLMQEYAGTVTDWRGGRLDGLRISIAKPVDDEDKYQSLLGESISSDDPLLKELGPKVYGLGLYY